MIHEFTGYYSSLCAEKKHRLFVFLVTHLGVNHDTVVGGAQRLIDCCKTKVPLNEQIMHDYSLACVGIYYNFI